MNALTKLLLALSAAVLVTTAVVAQDIDPESGLIIDTHWETVKGMCTACHSAKLITAQRGSRETWEQIIRWMQATQGLWQFDPQTETNILDYLAANYPPGEAYRRKPLSPLLMPANPYDIAAQQ